MKAVLEFTLPEENVEFRQACEASKVLAFVNDFENWLRTQDKYHAGDFSGAREQWYALKNDLVLDW